MVKKNLIFAGLGSIIVIAGSSVAGWALISNNETADQILANSKKIIPNINIDNLEKYSPEHVIEYWNSYKADFDFQSVEGYDARIDYEILGTPIQNNLELKLKIKASVKSKEFINHEYEVTIPKKFATVEESKLYIIDQTIQELPSFRENITLTEIPKPGISVSPAQVIFDFGDSDEVIIKDNSGPINTFLFTENGSKITVSNILDIYSKPAEIAQFKENYNTLIKPDNIDKVMEDFNNSVKNNNTIILFSITNEGVADNFSKGVSLMKNFTALDPSNSVENAIEFNLFLNSSTPPTAAQVIQSVTDGNGLKYLDFFNNENITPEDKAAFSKFNYNITKAELTKDDKKQSSLDVEVTISEKNNSNVNKKYTVVVNGLMSVQQEIFNKLLEGGEILLIPKITNSSLTMNQIVSDWQTSLAIEVDSTKYPDFVFTITGAEISPAPDGTRYISVFIKITNTIDTSLNYSYISAIFNGWT